MKKEKLHITVLKGGWGHEREVSLRSGSAIANALRQLSHTVEEVDVRERSFAIPSTDFVFICLHGVFGEDGELQAMLEARGLRFNGSGSKASRIAMDKLVSKALFRTAGVPTPKSAVWTPGMEWPLPFVLKPSSEGSSVGVFRIFKPEEIRQAQKEAFELGLKMMIEEMIVGRELTVSILGEEALPIIEIRPKSGFYDYSSKYTVGATEYLCPAPIDAQLSQCVQQISLQAYKALGCEVYGRVDLMLDQKGQLFVLEVNTIPGMTETSLLPKAAAQAGLSFPNLCQKIIDLSWDLKR